MHFQLQSYFSWFYRGKNVKHGGLCITRLWQILLRHPLQHLLLHCYHNRYPTWIDLRVLFKLCIFISIDGDLSRDWKYISWLDDKSCDGFQNHHTWIYIPWLDVKISSLRICPMIGCFIRLTENPSQGWRSKSHD